MDVTVSLGCLEVGPDIYCLNWMLGTFPVNPWKKRSLPHNEVFIVYTAIRTVVELLLLFGSVA